MRRELSRLEAVLARGDRRLCDVLEYAVRQGARLDGWREYFSLSTWDKAFEACGLDLRSMPTGPEGR